MQNGQLSGSEKAIGSSNLIKKVPGEVAPLGRLGHEVRSFEAEVKLKTVPELRVMLARQNGILTDRRLCRSLPDKGAKIKGKRDLLEVRY